MGEGLMCMWVVSGSFGGFGWVTWLVGFSGIWLDLV